VTIACNLADRAQRVPYQGTPPAEIRLASRPGAALQPDGIDIPPETVVIA